MLALTRLVSEYLNLPARLTAVVFVLHSAGHPRREHCDQEFLNCHGIVRLENAANFDAVVVVNWINGRIVAEPVEPLFGKAFHHVGTHLEEFWGEAKCVHGNSLGDSDDHVTPTDKLGSRDGKIFTTAPLRSSWEIVPMPAFVAKHRMYAEDLSAKTMLREPSSAKS